MIQNTPNTNVNKAAKPQRPDKPDEECKKSTAIHLKGRLVDKGKAG